MQWEDGHPEDSVGSLYASIELLEGILRQTSHSSVSMRRISQLHEQIAGRQDELEKKTEADNSRLAATDAYLELFELPVQYRSPSDFHEIIRLLNQSIAIHQSRDQPEKVAELGGQVKAFESALADFPNSFGKMPR